MCVSLPLCLSLPLPASIRFVTVPLATLTQYPDSMLTAMFSGKHKLATDENGRVPLNRYVLCLSLCFRVHNFSSSYHMWQILGPHSHPKSMPGPGRQPALARRDFSKQRIKIHGTGQR